MAWHMEPDVQYAVREFHQEFARQPVSAINSAKMYHEETTCYIRNILRRKGICKRFEYVGSIYEGLETGDDIEFDIIVVLDNVEFRETRIAPGFYNLECLSSSNPIVKKGWFFNNLPPSSIIDKFFGELQKAINGMEPRLNTKLVARRHGPAVQIDVYQRGAIWYRVDMVAAFEASGSLYVAKSFKGEHEGAGDSWRLSKTPQETQLLKTIDQDNGCRRECVRVLKVLFHREENLAWVTSYMLKTALFHSCDVYTSPSEWKRSDIGECVLRLLLVLREAFEDRSLDNHTVSGINLLHDFGSSTIENGYGRLKRWTTNRDVFMKVMAARNKAEHENIEPSSCVIL